MEEEGYEDRWDGMGKVQCYIRLRCKLIQLGVSVGM